MQTCKAKNLQIRFIPQSNLKSSGFVCKSLYQSFPGQAAAAQGEKDRTVQQGEENITDAIVE